MDIFLNNELSAIFERLDLIVHHNKSIFVARLVACYTGTQYVGICEFIHLVKGILFIFRNIHLCLGEFKQ